LTGAGPFRRSGIYDTAGQLAASSDLTVTSLKPGDTLVRQGETDSDLYLVLDG